MAGNLAAAACAAPSIGPVLGEWRGDERALAIAYTTTIQVTLYGAPGASSGTYDYGAAAPSMGTGVSERNFEWSGQWQMRPVSVAGQQMQLVHLAGLSGAHTSDFLLTPKNVLVPEPELAHLDLSKDAYLVALSPVGR